MKKSLFAVTLAVALASSTAAIAAPRGNPTATDGYQPGQWFNCMVLLPGPQRLGPCWVQQPDNG